MKSWVGNLLFLRCSISHSAAQSVLRWRLSASLPAGKCPIPDSSITPPERNQRNAKHRRCYLSVMCWDVALHFGQLSGWGSIWAHTGLLTNEKWYLSLWAARLKSQICFALRCLVLIVEKWWSPCQEEEWLQSRRLCCLSGSPKPPKQKRRRKEENHSQQSNYTPFQIIGMDRWRKPKSK